MNRLFGFPLLLLMLVSLSFEVSAQERAVTRSGREVILYRDGTWEYTHRQRFSQEEVIVKENGTGCSAELVFDDDLLLVLTDGKLTDYKALSDGGRVYGELHGELCRIGSYVILYDDFYDRIKSIGPYSIEYEFSTGRVKQIGRYPIEYDFRTGKITRIGNTYLKYSFFTGKLSELRGRTPGVRMVIF